MRTTTVLAVTVALVAVLFAATTTAYAQGVEVDADSLPDKVRMTTADGDIVFDIPAGKSFSVNRYKRAIDADVLTSEIEDLVAAVEATASDIQALNNATQPLAGVGPANTLRTQVAALNEGVENFVHADELAGLSTLVGAVASTAAAAQSIAEEAQETFPTIKSTITESNDLATSVFTMRINQGRTVTEVGSELAFVLSPATSTHTKLASDFRDAKDNALSMAASFEAKISDVEASIAGVGDVNGFIGHFGATHLGNSQYAVMRYRQFSTYMQCCGWYYGNRAEFYGGVAPSTWSDSNGLASSMSANTGILRNMFNQRIYCGANCAPHNEEWYSSSSTNGRHGAVLIRVRNTTPDAIQWTLKFFYSSYGGWAEQASLAINGQGIWNTGGNCGRCQRSQVITVPQDRVSTIILVVGSSPQSGTRTSHLAFFEDSLVLPDGLEYVDDLDTADQL